METEEEKIIVQCDKCNAKYRVKAPDKTAKYRCKKCQNIIFVKPITTICQFCGKENKVDSIYCDKCSQQLKNNIKKPFSKNNAHRKQVNKNKEYKPKLLFTIAIIIIIISTIFIIYTKKTSNINFTKDKSFIADSSSSKISLENNDTFEYNINQSTQKNTSKISTNDNLSTINKYQRNAMFGLYWNMSIDEIRSLGILLNFSEREKNLYVYTTSSLPKNLYDCEYYALVFAENKSLVEIIMIGDEFKYDPKGIKGKARFDELDEYISDNLKCGASKIKFGSSGDDFYEALYEDDVLTWYSNYNAEDKAVKLELVGTKYNTGFIKITVQAIPEFSNALNRSSNYVDKDEVDALK